MVYPANCDQVGTSAYNLNSPFFSMQSCGILTCSYLCSCWCNGPWLHVDLDSGVTQVQLDFDKSAANGVVT